jgi:hypothetical protein
MDMSGGRTASAGRLPEAWIAPPATGELRELVRHMARTGGRSEAGGGASMTVSNGTPELCGLLSGEAVTERVEAVKSLALGYRHDPGVVDEDVEVPGPAVFDLVQPTNRCARRR